MPRGRREDLRFITGRGRYVSDIVLPGMVHARFVRSPHAHARVLGIDASAALESPGVLAVFTGADLAADGLSDIPMGLALKRPGGAPLPPAARPILARDVVRHLGEAVAVVVARSADEAADAAENVLVSYEERDAVTSARAARATGAPGVWPEAPDNVGFAWSGGDRQAVDAALRAAAHRVSCATRVTRVAANPLEVRSALGEVDDNGRLVLHIGHQQPWALRDALATSIFRIDRDRIRILVPDVGGSFGLKTGLHVEEVVVLWAARRLGRPVRWVADRSEAFLGDDHSRDVDILSELALDGDGHLLALRVAFDVNVGCYLSGRSASPIGNIGGAAGVYCIPAISAEIFGVLTHTVPTGPYRGAGRPEATFAIERVLDMAARRIGLDPFELRRRNLIPCEAMPYKTALTFTYDCGDFRANMERAAEMADLAGFPARRAEAAERGKLRGIGIGNLIEAAGGPFSRIAPDAAQLRANPDGTVTLTTGALSTGQGVETAFSNLVAARLGIAPDRVVYVAGDTDAIAGGRGNGGSSASGVSGAAIAASVDALIEKARDLAADRLEAAAADISFSAGEFRVVGTDLGRSLADLAAAEDEANGEGLVAHREVQPEAVTFPNGCHICEVEIDPETGAVDLQRYTAVEDIGRVLEPVLVEGQIQGGVAQGLGQALLEQLSFDGSGQLVTGSLMDYAMPRASDMPAMRTATQEVPTAVNALGAKGVGEAGTVGSLVVGMNAICDALAPLGIVHMDMPASPARVRQAIAASRARSST